MIKKLLIIGVGLIGASFARALKRAGVVHEVVGIGRSQDNLATAKRLGAIDRSADSYAAAHDADVVLIAVPVGAVSSVLQSLAPHLRDDSVVTDVGSVKQPIIEAAHKILGIHAARFVPGHPIAGTEHSGAEASDAALFNTKRVILTPSTTTDPSAVALVRSLWQAGGAMVSEMEAGLHDRVFALTSHLPHVLAYAMVNSLIAGGRTHAIDLFAFAASGFRDFTRIASSDPTMWRDICVANRPALIQAMDQYRAELDRVMDAIERGDSAALERFFTEAKQARDRYFPHESS